MPKLQGEGLVGRFREQEPDRREPRIGNVRAVRARQGEAAVLRKCSRHIDMPVDGQEIRAGGASQVGLSIRAGRVSPRRMRRADAAGDADCAHQDVSSAPSNMPGLHRGPAPLRAGRHSRRHLPGEAGSLSKLWPRDCAPAHVAPLREPMREGASYMPVRCVFGPLPARASMPP